MAATRFDERNQDLPVAARAHGTQTVLNCCDRRLRYWDGLFFSNHKTDTSASRYVIAV